MAEETGNINNEHYQKYYQFIGRSAIMEKIWADAFGDNYPAQLDHYGYVTNKDLNVFAKLLDLKPSAKLLDIGCGKGGPGLKLAEKLKLKLRGIDIIPEAVKAAIVFQKNFQLTHLAQFRVGEFYSIPLQDKSMDAVISIDSLWTVADKEKALTEVKRVMKPGAKFIFTHWDLVNDELKYYFERSGLGFVSRGETPDWRIYQERVYDGILKNEKELVAEMGDAAQLLLHEAKVSKPYLDKSIRRIYLMELSEE